MNSCHIKAWVQWVDHFFPCSTGKINVNHVDIQSKQYLELRIQLRHNSCILSAVRYAASWSTDKFRNSRTPVVCNYNTDQHKNVHKVKPGKIYKLSKKNKQTNKQKKENKPTALHFITTETNNAIRVVTRTLLNSAHDNWEMGLLPVSAIITSCILIVYGCILCIFNATLNIFPKPRT